MKNILFAAFFLSMIAGYLSFKQIKQRKDNLPFIFTILSIGNIVIMTPLMFNLLISENPWLVNQALLLWFFILLSIAVEMFSLFKKYIPGQLLAASMFIFLVIPTIFSIGIFLLLIAIVEIVIALIIFQKDQRLKA